MAKDDRGISAKWAEKSADSGRRSTAVVAVPWLAGTLLRRGERGATGICSSRRGLGLPVTGDANGAALRFVTCSLGVIPRPRRPARVSVRGASPGFYSWRSYQGVVCDEKSESRDGFVPTWIHRVSRAGVCPGPGCSATGAPGALGAAGALRCRRGRSCAGARSTGERWCERRGLGYPGSSRWLTYCR